MKLPPKLTIFFLLLSILPTAIVGYLAYENGRRTIMQKAKDHLVSINIFKSNELKRWVEDNQSSIEELVQRPLVRQHAEALAKHGTSDPVYRKAKASIVEDHLKPRLKDENFFELFIMCPRDGIISASTDEKQEGKYQDSYPYFIEGKKRTHVQGVYYSPALEQPAMTIGTPIKDKQGNLLGVLAGRLNLGELSKIIALQSGDSQTEDTYLVNTFNFFVTEPRFGQGYALKKGVRTKAVEAGLSGRDGVDFYKGYRGMPVIGAYKWLPDFRMCIITKIDEAEAFAPIVHLAWVITGIASAISLAAGLLGIFFARTITRPVRQLAAGAEKIGGGNLEYRVGTASKDEIGGLSRAFDRMTENLKLITVSRNDLIKEIEKRELAEKTLRATSSRQEAILSAVPDIIMEVDVNKVYTWANQPGFDFFGEDVVGKEAAFYFEGEQETYETAKPLFNGSENTIYIESLQRRNDGQKRLLAWWCRVLKDDSGNVTGALSSARDITEHEQAEEEIRKLNDELEQRVRNRTAQLEAANKEMEAFSYSVSHDLRAPLRAVDGYTRILLEDYAANLSKDAQSICGNIREGAQRMGRLIDDLLAFSRLGRAEMQASPIDMQTLANSVFFELTTSEKRESVDFRLQALPGAKGDPTMVRQVWMNLISNALKFSSKREGPIIELGCHEEAKETIYYIRDNGAGFDKQYIHKLFGVFQRLHSTREFEGTGVGLAIVRRIVQRHGGRTWAEGEIDKGATFYFSLPRK